MTGKRKYHCKRCHYSKWIPGRDEDLEKTIRTGCENCERITPFKKVGVP